MSITSTTTRYLTHPSRTMEPQVGYYRDSLVPGRSFLKVQEKSAYRNGATNYSRQH